MNKKIYEKPQVNQVKLEVGEAVLTPCKLEKGAVGSGSVCHASSCRTTYGS